MALMIRIGISALEALAAGAALGGLLQLFRALQIHVFGVKETSAVGTTGAR